ncbi:MAG: DUF1501 domain-containing protein [Planctomycetes bacterium]|nr:DUF1501 domain-containing protein [Planctomycetota bacterium]
MISIFGNESTRTCFGVNRREFLRVGGLTLGGLTLSNLLSSHAAASTGASVFKDKSVVLLFLHGGAPQVETFDPKPEQRENIRSSTGHVQTNLPGVRIGGTFPKLAAMADRFTIVRSFGSGFGDHDPRPVLTGGNRLRAPIGSLVSRTLGNVNPQTGLPSNIVVVPESVRPELVRAQEGVGQLNDVRTQYVPAGNLGSNDEAFLPTGGRALIGSLQLRLERNRFEDRRRLLAQVDTFRRRLDATGDLAGLDAYQRQAHDVLLRDIAAAFDLNREDQRLIDRYDTSRYFVMENYQRGGPLFNGRICQSIWTNLLGKQMLLARRLCEAGSRFVTVVDSGWDMHGNANSMGVPAGMQILGPQVDHAVAAFLEDVHQRGLSDKIVLIVTSEMGRGQRNNTTGGSEHWGDLTPLLIAGGGLRMGQVIGESDRAGQRPVTRRYRPENLLTTVLQTMFDTSEVRVNPSLVPAEIANVMNNGAPPIAELFA